MINVGMGPGMRQILKSEISQRPIRPPAASVPSVRSVLK